MVSCLIRDLHKNIPIYLSISSTEMIIERFECDWLLKHVWPTMLIKIILKKLDMFSTRTWFGNQNHLHLTQTLSQIATFSRRSKLLFFPNCYVLPVCRSNRILLIEKNNERSTMQSQIISVKRKVTFIRVFSDLQMILFSFSLEKYFLSVNIYFHINPNFKAPNICYL